MLGRRILVAGLLFEASPAAVAQTVSLTLGTTPDGGGFAPYSVALIETLKSIDRDLQLRPVDTRGSTDNAARLQAGSIDLGLVSGEVFDESEARARGRLKIVSVMYYTPGMFAVLGNSPHRTISDLRGQAIVWQPRGTGSAVQARYVMHGLGLDVDRDFAEIYPANFTDGPEYIFDGSAAALWASGLRLPSFVRIAEHPFGVRFIAPNAEEIARIRAAHPFLVPLTVPRGTYPGQTEPIATIGSASFIVARPDLDEAHVHRLAAALHKLEKFEARPTYLAQTTTANTLASVESPEELHPGVLRYFREAGIVP
ncbi:TAXI family TRAP transporter solute-binding subunit [Reyranella sp.]|uniref:TAXI family TRAP transporter solute-binding subunit n=1 Tax=Reyranella sp. TaxID=1929291 RepID=UPI003D109B99